MEQETRMGRGSFAGHRRMCPSGGRPHPSVHKHPNRTSHVKEVETAQGMRTGVDAQSETHWPVRTRRLAQSQGRRFTFRVALT
jgi:hypothetical protein